MAGTTHPHEQLIEEILGYAQARRARRITPSTRTTATPLRKAA